MSTIATPERFDLLCASLAATGKVSALLEAIERRTLDMQEEGDAGAAETGMSLHLLATMARAEPAATWRRLTTTLGPAKRPCPMRSLTNSSMLR